MSPDGAPSECCRMRLYLHTLEHRDGGLFGAIPLTGSVGVVTINMTRLGYLTIGLVGLNEVRESLLRTDIATEKGQLFGLRVLEFVREKLVAFQEETSNNCSLGATPAEDTSPSRGSSGRMACW